MSSCLLIDSALFAMVAYKLRRLLDSWYHKLKVHTELGSATRVKTALKW